MQLRQLIKKTPIPLLVIGMGSTQVGAAFATKLFSQAGATGTVFLRLLFATIILLVIWRPKLANYDTQARLSAVKFGVALGMMNLCFYESIARIPLGVAVTIEFVGPLAVAILGSRHRLDVLWAFLAAGGILLLSLAGNHHSGGVLNATGVAFALLAGVFWALYIIFAARSTHHFQDGKGLTLATCVALVIVTVPGISSANVDLLDPSLLVSGAIVGFASSVVPYSLETEALRYIPKNLFGVLMSLEPAVAATSGWIVLDQTLTAQELFAIALVICASVGAERTTKIPTTSEGS